MPTADSEIDLSLPALSDTVWPYQVRRLMEQDEVSSVVAETLLPPPIRSLLQRLSGADSGYCRAPATHRMPSTRYMSVPPIPIVYNVELDASLAVPALQLRGADGLVGR
jgi:hypothetical protein